MEAEAYPGTSIIIAYSPCIAWGTDMIHNHEMQDRAVRSGHFPLYRFDPRRAAEGQNPLQLDSKAPSIPYRDFTGNETRFNMLRRSHPEAAERFLNEAQARAYSHFHYYQQLAEIQYGKERDGEE
ncbi:MAG TPA: pyruvate:ferredoxin (flavodoxin) oxidoreductase, partial [Gammaproteobacteria bacterium]|nr:pyruvate:ferredoxin (flavodoxin) oxidoreductase [Gammaproteobacteria bacterium]